MGYSVLRSKDMHFTRAQISRLWVEGITVDFVRPRNLQFVNSAFARLEKGDLKSAKIPILAPEDVFLYKALSKRERDIAPMSALSDRADFDRVYVEKWARKLGVWLFAKRAINDGKKRPVYFS